MNYLVNESALAEHGLLSEEELRQAQETAVNMDISLMHAIEKLGLLRESAVLDVFSHFYNVRAINLQKTEIDSALTELIPKQMAYKLRIVPIRRHGERIEIASGDPCNYETINVLRFRMGLVPTMVLASELRITESLEKLYGRDLDESLQRATDEISVAPVTRRKREEIAEAGPNDGPVVNLANQILTDCVRKGASDIHIEPYEDEVRVRFRIDGILVEVMHLPHHIAMPLISRLKVQSRLNIAEKRMPQDGCVQLSIDGRPIDFRISTTPAHAGEKVVMRVLDKSTLNMDLEQIGMERDDMERFQKAISAPQGMVLITGPTGSGKTTTLYSVLNSLNTPTTNIMTVEDPVEFSVRGVNQVQTNPIIGLTFAHAIRSFLRQDPEIIMVGEIRDEETAEISVSASLTGHILLSTLHTNSATETITRLLNMGLKRYNLSSALSCIVAQRLVRKICKSCREVDPTVTPKVMAELGLDASKCGHLPVYRGKGCNACGGTGTKGRTAIYEVLTVSDTLREAILNEASANELVRIAQAEGMRTLRQAALMKMLAGDIGAIEVANSTVDASPKRAHLHAVAGAA